MLAPIRVRPFGRLLASYSINDLGDAVGALALAVLVYDHTDSALATTALFVCMRFLPALLAPALTARLDQLDSRRILPLIYVVEAIAFGVLVILAENFALILVLAVALVDGTLALTARGLTRGAIARVLTPRDLLREGNGLVNVGFAVASVGGAAVGGLLVESAGVATALALDAGTFALAAVILATARDMPTTDAERTPALSRLREGLGYAARDKFVRALLAGQALALLFFTLIVPIEVVYAKETLNTDDAGFGALLAAWGAGIVIGSAVFLVVKRRSPRAVVLMSTAAVGVAYLGMSATDELLVACLLSVLGGTGNGVQWVSVVTLLQETTPQDLQARISGLLESIGAAVPGLGFVLGGVLTALISPEATFFIAGCGVMLLVLAGLFVRPMRSPVAQPSRP